MDSWAEQEQRLSCVSGNGKRKQQRGQEQMEHGIQEEYGAAADEKGIISQGETEGHRPETAGWNQAVSEGMTIGKYRVLRILGRGGEGSVYLARDEQLQRLVAIKCVREPGAEAEYLQRLRHPMLPVIYDLLQGSQGRWYLVMEYLKGVTLQNHIEKNGFVQERQARIWAGQLVDVLTYLHTRKPPVIYSDLKPANIIVCPDGQLRLVDFGAALTKSFGAGRKNRIAVTPGYGAPEQQGCIRQGGQDDSGYGGTGVCADERSDIYALGKTLYYMVTGADPGRPPYAALPVYEYQPLFGDDLEKIIRKCVRLEPEKRYQTVEEVRRELDRSVEGKRRTRRKSFLRVIEKRVWLTEGENSWLQRDPDML